MVSICKDEGNYKMKPKQNGHNVEDDIFKRIFMNVKCISIEILLKFVPGECTWYYVWLM